jgi:pyroglutamyl-peptidase
MQNDFQDRGAPQDAAQHALETDPGPPRRILITGFEPYGTWSENSSQRCLEALCEEAQSGGWPLGLKIKTELFPVDFPAVRARLAELLVAEQFDLALHLGQSPAAEHVQFEWLAVNVGGVPDAPRASLEPLEVDGPQAYRSRLPLGPWIEALNQSQFPATASYHAGTYLCNATLYWSHYLAERNHLALQATFLHLPVDVQQAAACRGTVWRLLELISDGCSG